MNVYDWFVLACLIIAFVCIFSGSTEDWVGVVCILATVGFIAFMVLSISVDERDDKQIEKKVRDACYPLVVTNRASKDGRIVFDCANDGKLRVVR